MIHVGSIKFSLFSRKRDDAPAVAGSAKTPNLNSARPTDAGGTRQRIKQFFARKPGGNAADDGTSLSFASVSLTELPISNASSVAVTSAPMPPPKLAPPVPPKIPLTAQGLKIKGDYIRVSDEKIRVSDLVTADGQKLAMSQTLETGSFGKFRLAIDANDKAWAVKEFRSELFQHNLKYDGDGYALAPKTHVTQTSEIQREVDIGYELNSALRIERLIDVGGKIYATLPLMDGGDVFNLVTAHTKRLQKSPTSRVALALGLMESMGSQLADMHRNNFVHNDIKLENVLLNRSGQFAISDFGGVSKIGALGLTYGPIFTLDYLAPERVVDTRGMHTKATDLFAAGMSVLNIYAAAINAPLSFGTIDAADSFRQLHFDFLAFKKGQVTSTFEDSYKSPMGQVILQMEQDNPKLAHFMLERVMDPNPHTRVTAEHMQTFASSLQSEKYKTRLLYLMKNIDSSIGSISKNDKVLRSLRERAEYQRQNSAEAANNNFF
jgi:serine/threonine protein kinase